MSSASHRNVLSLMISGQTSIRLPDDSGFSVPNRIIILTILNFIYIMFLMWSTNSLHGHMVFAIILNYLFRIILFDNAFFWFIFSRMPFNNLHIPFEWIQPSKAYRITQLYFPGKLNLYLLINI